MSRARAQQSFSTPIDRSQSSPYKIAQPTRGHKGKLSTSTSPVAKAVLQAQRKPPSPHAKKSRGHRRRSYGGRSSESGEEDDEGAGLPFRDGSGDALFELPAEVLHAVFSLLSGWSDRLCASHVCTRWRQAMWASMLRLPDNVDGALLLSRPFLEHLRHMSSGYLQELTVHVGAVLTEDEGEEFDVSGWDADFAHTLTLRAQGLPEPLDLWKYAASFRALRTLRVRSMTYHRGESIQAIQRLRSLNSLSIRKMDSGYQRYGRLYSSVATLTTLTHLDLCSDRHSSDTGLVALTTLTNLVSLNIGRGLLYTDEAVEALSRTLTNLTSLAVGTAEFTEFGLGAVVAHLPGLRQLHITESSADGPSFSLLAEMPSLHSLRLQRCQVSDDAFAIMASGVLARQLTQLALIDVDELADEGLQAVGWFAALCDLRLDLEALGEDAFRAVCNLPRLSRLVVKQAGELGAEALSSLSKLTALEHLELPDGAEAQACVQAVRAARRMPRLAAPGRRSGSASSESESDDSSAESSGGGGGGGSID